MEDDSPYDIAVSSQNAAAGAPPELIRKAVACALSAHRCPSARISVALVDDAQIADLNQRFLNHVGPTDVLSFRLSDDGESLEGEIVVSVETASREARARGHDCDAEIALYAVHGALHLLGMDDADSSQADAMHEMEDRLLTDIGVGPVYGARSP